MEEQNLNTMLSISNISAKDEQASHFSMLGQQINFIDYYNLMKKIKKQIKNTEIEKKNKIDISCNDIQFYDTDEEINNKIYEAQTEYANSNENQDNYLEQDYVNDKRKRNMMNDSAKQDELILRNMKTEIEDEQQLGIIDKNIKADQINNKNINKFNQQTKQNRLETRRLIKFMKRQNLKTYNEYGIEKKKYEWESYNFLRNQKLRRFQQRSLNQQDDQPEYNYKQAKELNSSKDINESIYDQLVVQVSIQHPINKLKNQEFKFLGNQSLSDIIDNMYCLYDYQNIYDKTSMIKKVPSPSFILFEPNKFYIDQRLVNTGQKHLYDKLKEKLNKFKDKISKDSELTKININITPEEYSMEKTKLIDLNIRIGVPGIIQHSNNCQHMLCITNIRLFDIDQGDIPSQTEWPILTQQSSFKKKQCQVCSKFFAKFMVKGDSLKADNFLSKTHEEIQLCEYCIKQWVDPESKDIVTPQFHE